MALSIPKPKPSDAGRWGSSPVGAALKLGVRVGTHAGLGRRTIHLDTLLVDVDFVGGLVLSNCNRHAATVVQRRNGLHYALSEGLGSHDLGSPARGCNTPLHLR